jgi:hypothetical protein
MKTCCICRNNFVGYGNNPYPLTTTGSCCNECNQRYVIPARLAGLTIGRVIANASFYTREELHKIDEAGYFIDEATNNIYYTIGPDKLFISKRSLEKELKIGEYEKA